MSGTIWFETAEELARFLTAFTGCTAIFDVVPVAGGYTLTITEGF